MRVALGETVGQGAPMLSLRGVGKTFAGGVDALGRLDLDLNEGDFLTLLGPSGCGKSTALRIVAGLARPSRGRVEWHGAPGSVGYVFQEPTLMPWASVFDNVWLPLRLRKVSRDEARGPVTAMLERVGLAGFSQAVPRELSGGMRMRVSIARALVTRPRLLLMDEPFAALDEITRFALNAELMRLREAEGFTVLFVTHSVFESVFLSSRIAVMAARPGRIFGEMAVDEPFPRAAGFRTSTAYAALCRQASDMLAAAMGAPPP